MMDRLRALLRFAGDTARAMVGVGSYDAYRAHMAADHPERVPMTEQEYFDDRMKAHFGEGKSGVSRCC